jgi:HD-GYP domain-containing protein (c-di-GMP phosphodiesterase class II)
MHHERCDSTGYPLRLRSDQIDPFAKIVAIADVYDATTSPRVYRGPMCPFEVIDIFEQDGLQKYDPKFILVILENIVNTYLLETVRLSDGNEGQVIYINKNHLSRPTIKIGNSYVDLSVEKDLNILEII